MQENNTNPQIPHPPSTSPDPEDTMITIKVPNWFLKFLNKISIIKPITAYIILLSILSPFLLITSAVALNLNWSLELNFPILITFLTLHTTYFSIFKLVTMTWSVKNLEKMKFKKDDEETDIYKLSYGYRKHLSIMTFSSLVLEIGLFFVSAYYFLVRDLVDEEGKVGEGIRYRYSLQERKDRSREFIVLTVLTLGWVIILKIAMLLMVFVRLSSSDEVEWFYEEVQNLDIERGDGATETRVDEHEEEEIPKLIDIVGVQEVEKTERVTLIAQERDLLVD